MNSQQKLRAEIISIGDELSSGQRLDTNSQWLSQRLNDLGITTVFHSTVGDDLQANVDVFRTAAARVDVIIATGGLGPTADDLTREAIGVAFERSLELRPEALAHIESLFATQAAYAGTQSRPSHVSRGSSHHRQSPRLRTRYRPDGKHFGCESSTFRSHLFSTGSSG